MVFKRRALWGFFIVRKGFFEEVMFIGGRVFKGEGVVGVKVLGK